MQIYENIFDIFNQSNFFFDSFRTGLSIHRQIKNAERSTGLLSRQDFQTKAKTDFAGRNESYGTIY